jgi:hypothetical protein
MATPPIPATDHHARKSIATMEDQLNFAWRNFEDQQAIIRAADLKAGYLVTFLLFFAASTIPLGEQVFPKIRWTVNVAGATCALYLISYSWLRPLALSDLARAHAAHRPPSSIAARRL